MYIDLRPYGNSKGIHTANAVIDFEKCYDLRLEVHTLNASFKIKFKNLGQMDEFVSLFSNSGSNFSEEQMKPPSNIITGVK